MQHTENLKLNLVEGTDAFSQEPLNENMRLLDESVGEMDGDIEKLEESTEKLERELEKLGGSVGTLEESARLLGAELAKKGTCSVVSSTYTGNGAALRRIEVGFTPSLLILFGWCNNIGSLAFITRSWDVMVQSNGFGSGTNVQMTESGFTVSGESFNRNNTKIDYIAFS